MSNQLCNLLFINIKEKFRQFEFTGLEEKDKDRDKENTYIDLEADYNRRNYEYDIIQ